MTLKKVDPKYKIMALTVRWPGSWARGDSIRDAKQKLRETQGNLTGIPVVYYLVHPETTMDSLGRFTHLEEYPPIRLGE